MTSAKRVTRDDNFSAMVRWAEGTLVAARRGIRLVSHRRDRRRAFAIARQVFNDLAPEERRAIRDEIDRLVETGALFEEAKSALSRFVDQLREAA